MAVYADYDFYSTVYFGAVKEDVFARLATRASSFIDYYTQHRAQAFLLSSKDEGDVETQVGLSTIPELAALKMCCCALVDKYAVIEAAQTTAIERSSGMSEPSVKSESVGGYSRTLATSTETVNAALGIVQNGDALLAQTCRAYLGHTGLLSRGGGRCKACMPPTL